MPRMMIMKSIILNDNLGLKKILDSGLVNPNFLLNGRTPIKLATSLKNTEAVKILMRYNCYPQNLNSPLHCAVKKGDFEAVKNLLNKHEYINNVFYDNGYTPLNLAVVSGFTQIARLLLENGADTDICSTDLFTPLHMAVRMKHKDMINLLLVFGANTNLEDCFRCTPLIHACAEGDVETCESLISYGADVDYITSAGDTALSSGVDNNKLNIVRLLLDKGANSNIIFERGSKFYSIMEVTDYSKDVTRSVSAIIADVVLSKHKDLDHISKIGQDKNLAVINNLHEYRCTASRCETELGILSRVTINGVSLLNIYTEELWHLVQGNSKIALYQKVIEIDRSIFFYNYILENIVSIASNN
ncbi:ankyrin repeat protein [Cheloniid poxvirus 1]|nr:ankyrin repeat protein [Cheloniid poxvirus 1]